MDKCDLHRSSGPSDVVIRIPERKWGNSDYDDRLFLFVNLSFSDDAVCSCCIGGERRLWPPCSLLGDLVIDRASICDWWVVYWSANMYGIVCVRLLKQDIAADAWLNVRGSGLPAIGCKFPPAESTSLLGSRLQASFTRGHHPDRYRQARVAAVMSQSGQSGAAKNAILVYIESLLHTNAASIRRTCTLPTACSRCDPNPATAATPSRSQEAHSLGRRCR